MPDLSRCFLRYENINRRETPDPVRMNVLEESRCGLLWGFTSNSSTFVAKKKLKTEVTDVSVACLQEIDGDRRWPHSASRVAEMETKLYYSRSVQIHVTEYTLHFMWTCLRSGLSPGVLQCLWSQLSLLPGNRRTRQRSSESSSEGQSAEQKMPKVQTLRVFMKQRLTAAAEEIFELFERTIAEYEEELCRQRKLLDAVGQTEDRLHRQGLFTISFQ